MRAILIDWLVEVNLKFKLVPETLYLNIALIDMYLEKAEVVRNKLQLVGVTALLIASKYEEIYPPEIRDLVYITDKAYNKREVGIHYHFSFS
jgi:cyclin B